MTTVAIYTRLSKDDTGDQTATQRQEKACRLFAEVRGWAVAEVYEDVDVSAYQKRVVRPAYERMLEAVEGGRVNGVLVWKLDRLVRRPAEFERFWTVCEGRGAVLASATEPIDSSTELGLALVRILVAFASLESATLGMRIRAKARADAEAGKPPPGQRFYGYTVDCRTVVGHEAAIVGEIAQRLIDGWTVSRVAKDLRDRAVVMPSGNRGWTCDRVRKLMMSFRLVGDRTFNGEVVVKGCYPPVLDRLTHARVRATLVDPPARRLRVGGPFLLTGLLKCGKCGGKMYSHRNSGRESYCCASRQTGCGGIHVNTARLDDWMREVVLWRLGRRSARALASLPAGVRAPSLEQALNEFTDAMLELSHDYFGAKLIDRESYVLSRIELRAILQERERAAVLAGERRHYDAVEISAGWDTASIEERRAVVASELQFAVVNPAASPGMRFTPQRIVPVWWEALGGRDGEVPEHLRHPPPRNYRPRPWGNPPDPSLGRITARTVFTYNKVTVAEAARLLGDVSTDVVRRLVRDGELPGEKVGGIVRIPRRDVDTYLRRSRMASRARPRGR